MGGKGFMGELGFLGGLGFMGERGFYGWGDFGLFLGFFNLDSVLLVYRFYGW